MNFHVLKIVERIRASYWFVPTLMALGSILLALSAETLDRSIDIDVDALAWIYKGGPEGARTMLGAIAGSMITVAGVAFSITMVVLVLASSQFGPRILSNFMRDRGNQVVLGTFIATFLYCLVLLRSVRGTENSAFVPYVAVTLAVVLAVVSVGVLIYFIDHVAGSIQAPTVVARVGSELDAMVARRFPTPPLGEEDDEGEVPIPAVTQPTGTRAADLPDGAVDEASLRSRVTAHRSGYVELIDMDELLELAEKHDLRLVCRKGVGDLVYAGDVLVACSELPDGAAGRIRGAFAIGRRRTTSQDIEFVALQLVEIAVRALSPGINDPFTASDCVDRLGAALARAAAAPAPDGVVRDSAGHARLVVRPLTFPDLLETSFSQIRAHARDSPDVLARLLERIAAIAERVRRPEDARALLRQAVAVHEASDRLLPTDRKRLAQTFERVRSDLDDHPTLRQAAID